MTSGHRPRRRFSQNFLHDRNVIDRLVATIDPHPDDAVVEIGPGEGALTSALLERSGRLTAIEVDSDLAAGLAEWPGLSIHEGDSLAFDFTALAAEKAGPIRLVGNLPYNISTPLLFHALEHSPAIQDMHFLLQREVVERLAAEPAGKDYGRLSVMVQYRCRVEPLFRVAAGAFRPAPRVTSQLVRLVPHAEPPVAVHDEALFRQVVAAAFGQRRKTLRNALGTLLTAADFDAAGVSPGERAERLGLAEFAALTNARYERRARELS